MKVVLQRVKKASVKVDGELVSSIQEGYLLLVGIAADDTKKQLVDMARKISKLRIIDDNMGKMNLDILANGGEILSVSQFTLVGALDEGNRPGFSPAASGDIAEMMWREFNENLRNFGCTVKEGIFGAQMDVSLVNDGPVTFVLDFSNNIR
jgi:D-aminoacyl-tRNA deacylase